ncbi:MAG: type III polyketide synthase [Cyclobacteriaceae bacterium]|nr:type III polyketide synthase [Cyclobacteriaceae bacterium HetDA_MAG_MS6]
MSAYISSIGTATPPLSLPQTSIADFMVKYLELSAEEEKALRVLYRASGISHRGTVLADYADDGVFHFFPQDQSLEPFPTTQQRMVIFKEEALFLAMQAAEQCLEKSTVKGQHITHLITVSCTGMYAPGLDIELLESLGLATDTERTAINFMGCYASFNALKCAQKIIASDPDAKVLLVSVELCSIHFQKNKDEDTLLSNALFADGAAAALVTSGGYGNVELRLAQFYSDLALEGRNEMGWFIGDFGFEMKLSAKVPDVIRQGIGQLTSRLLRKLDLSVQEIQHFALHPGGKRILEVIEAELGITKAQNQSAHHILRQHGNMSSPTVLFVIQDVMKGLASKQDGEHILSFAFGPGLTLESMLLEVKCQ